MTARDELFRSLRFRRNNMGVDRTTALIEDYRILAIPTYPDSALTPEQAQAIVGHLRALNHPLLTAAKDWERR